MMVDQLEAMLYDLHEGQFTTIADYLEQSYINGYVGMFYDLQSTDIPLVIPIQQDQVVKALKTNSKLSSGLYKRLGEDVDYLKRSIRAELSRGTDLAGKTTELTKANELIAELKKSGGKDDETQQKIATYETEIADLKKENAELKTENALKFALMAAGAVDVDYLVFKAKEKGEIKLTEDGKIKGEDDLITGLKTQHPAMFQVSNGNQQNNRKILENNLPNCDNDKTVTKEQFLKMGFNERMKLKEENPDLFKQLNTH